MAWDSGGHLKGLERLRRQTSNRKKIRSLWLEMFDAGFVRDSSERAINAYAHRITGVGRLEWLGTDQASRVIETLKKWQKRELKAQAALQ